MPQRGSTHEFSMLSLKLPFKTGAFQAPPESHDVCERFFFFFLSPLLLLSSAPLAFILHYD